MISIIIFIIGVIVTYSTSIIVLNDSMAWWSISLIALLAIVGMIAINGFVAIVCCKILPKKCFNSNFKFFKVSKKEFRFYEKLGVKKWKDKTIELGKLNGFRKNKMTDPNNPEYIQRFIVENNMGFLTHFISLIMSGLAIFIMPMKFWLPMALPIAITSFILNVIPIAILRYNIPRLQILLKYSQRNVNN